MSSQLLRRSRKEGCLGPEAQDQPGQHSKTPISDFLKISQACWHVLVVSATREAEVGGSLESGKVEVAVSCDCATALQPGDKAKPCF